jgi:diaminohydroxyphosphoribosylaminopyrimidine deaminase/5-amino-6-(5-phosphoribosylamino)uracil reductase
MPEAVRVDDPREFFMRQALALASRGAGLTRPNPLVGALVVKNGRVAGSGWHERCGTAHAELKALDDARRRGTEDLSDAVLYVNLEPCCHFGRTPPCVDAILASGLRRVVIGMRDPNPLVNGGGAARLREAGLEVIEGVLESECRELNRAFVKRMASGRPFVLLKSAMSADGKAAGNSGDARWISCEESRREVHRLRAESAAVMCGIGTALADDPELSARGRGSADEPLLLPVQPLRVVADSDLRLPLDSRLARTARGLPLLVAGAESAEAGWGERRKALEGAGVRVLRAPRLDGRVDLRWLMEALGSEGADSLLLEGGPSLAWSALRAGIVDRARIYCAPLFLGGASSAGPVGGEGFSGPASALRLENFSVRRCGADVVMEGVPCSPG